MGTYRRALDTREVVRSTSSKCRRRAPAIGIRKPVRERGIYRTPRRTLLLRMTFMGGGRSCIGFKFAEAEISTHRVFSPFSTRHSRAFASHRGRIAYSDIAL